MESMRLLITSWGILSHSSRRALSNFGEFWGGWRPATHLPRASQTCSIGFMFVAAVAEWYRYRMVACFVTGSSPVPLKTCRVGQRCTLNLSRAETSSRWCGVVVRRGVPAQVSSTSLDHGSKLRGPSPKALV
ncbi:uncharacterized protein TNCV_4611251 [Trichonephila clavipes]|nr:uncharacterized protein TNCV_4611251 [Trichonephila clavipes]